MIEKLQYISNQSGQISHLDTICRALDAGCQWIQLRIKAAPEAIIAQQAIVAKKLCERYQAKLIINDFPWIAKEVEADGLHLGLTDMAISEARSLLGKQMTIGGTANTFEDIQQRVREGADYIGLGPFRFTTTKERLSPILGLEGYAKILHQMREAGLFTPIIAIGGILIEDVSAILKTGVYGIAVSGALTNSPNPNSFVEKVQSIIEEKDFLVSS